MAHGRQDVHFGPHVAAGTSGLSRPDLKAPSAQIDLQFGQLHLSSLHVTLNLATTPAGD